MITEINCETGEVITREPNAEELAQLAIDEERTANEKAELAAKECSNAKQSLIASDSPPMKPHYCWEPTNDPR